MEESTNCAHRSNVCFCRRVSVTFLWSLPSGMETSKKQQLVPLTIETRKSMKKYRATTNNFFKKHGTSAGSKLAVASTRTLFFLKNMIYRGKAACCLFGKDEAFGVVVTLIRWHVPQPGTIRSFIAAHACHRSTHREISRISRPANNYLMGQNRDKRSGNSRDNSL